MVRTVIFDLGGVLIEWNPDRILEGYYADPEMRAIYADRAVAAP
jgi:FMN phosphatase YigB (HAD superfamily)